MRADRHRAKDGQPWRASRIKNLRWIGTQAEANEFLSFFRHPFEWRDQGVAREAVFADGERVYWWRATGMVTRVFSGQGLARAIEKPSLAAPKTWAVLDAGEGKGMSLPELAVNRPHAFFRDLFAGRFPKAEKPFAQLVGYRAQNIKLPVRQSAGHTAAYFVDFNDRYYGFELIPGDRLPLPFRGRIYIADRVNLSLFCDSKKASEEAGTRRSFLSYYGDPDLDKWPREQCEAFFVRAENFV